MNVRNLDHEELEFMLTSASYRTLHIFTIKLRGKRYFKKWKTIMELPIDILHF